MTSPVRLIPVPIIARVARAIAATVSSAHIEPFLFISYEKGAHYKISWAI